MKKIIGIDINEVIRGRSLQFDRFYYDEFDGIGLPPEDDPYKFDLRNDYLWEDGEEKTDYLNEEYLEDKNISSIDYQINEETGKAIVDDLIFKPEIKKISADEKFKRFLYEDYLFEIHGSAPLIYKGLEKHLENFYQKYSNQYEIKIISKENWFTIPPTLFFLSKMMSRITKYSFVNTNEDVWNEVDILITTDPELLERPIGKSVVKLFRPYNENSPTDIPEIELLQIYDLIDNVEFEKLIGYEKPEEIKEEIKEEK